MAEHDEPPLGSGSAAELLSAWRAAERDHAAALDASDTAGLAALAAGRAATAARETAEAARLSLEAATRAERAAQETADAADVLSAAVRHGQALAEAAVDTTKAAELEAKVAFRDAQAEGFPKESR